MFWRKKPQAIPLRLEINHVEIPAKSALDQLYEASDNLSTSLRNYSEAAYKSAQVKPDEGLIEARAKVEAATKIAVDGRLGYALGRCIPQHIEHWPSWITRDDFKKWVYFDAHDIGAQLSSEQDGSRNIKIVTVHFSFNENRYIFVLRDRGMSYVPDALERLGDVELWLDEIMVAKFGVTEDISNEYSQWEFCDVQALRVGPWMKDVIDIATQIETGHRRQSEEFLENRMLEAANNINLN